MPTFHAIIWRPKTFWCDRESDTQLPVGGHVLHIVRVESEGPGKCIRMWNVETGEPLVLNSWLPKDPGFFHLADQLPVRTNLPDLAGRKTFKTESIEGIRLSLRARVDWKVLKVDDLGEELRILEEHRSQAMKKRAWSQLGELADEIRILEEGRKKWSDVQAST